MSESVYRQPYRRPLPLRYVLPRIVSSGPVLLTDDFDDNSRDVTKWTLGSIAFENAGVGVAEANQQVEITPLALTGTPAIYGYKSVEAYDFTAREVAVRIAADIATDTEAWLVVAIDADNYFRTWVAGGTLQTRSRVAANNTNESHGAFSFATHKYWRIRHDDGSDEIVWEYSTTGGEWLELRRLARPVAITSVSIYLSGGTGSSVASPALIKFDDFNLRTPAAFSTFERSAAISATASIESVATSFSVFERSAAMSATGAITVSGVREVERSAEVSGAAAVAVSGQFLSVLERTVALEATTAVTASGTRVVERAASLSGVAAIETSGVGFTVHEAATALNTTGSIGTGGSSFSVIERGGSLDAVATVTTTGLRVVERAAAVAATATVTVSGESFAVLERTISVAATAAIDTVATFHSTHERQAALTGTTGITTSRQVELSRRLLLDATVSIAVSGGVEGGVFEYERSVTLNAGAVIAVTAYRGHERAVLLTATGTATVTAQRELLRTVQLGTTATITTSGFVGGLVLQRAVALNSLGSITVNTTVRHPAPSQRTFVVESELRTVFVSHESRRYFVGEDNRQS